MREGGGTAVTLFATACWPARMTRLGTDGTPRRESALSKGLNATKNVASAAATAYFFSKATRSNCMGLGSWGELISLLTMPPGTSGHIHPFPFMAWPFSVCSNS